MPVTTTPWSYWPRAAPRAFERGFARFLAQNSHELPVSDAQVHVPDGVNDIPSVMIGEGDVVGLEYHLNPLRVVRTGIPDLFVSISPRGTPYL